MLRSQLVDMIYEELFNELHKKGHKDPKGRQLMKGNINKSDAKYTMRMMFDNHGFGKALKHMKILRRGITLNMSSYMGPGKVLTKIVKDFNEVMGTKYKIDNDSFQKGHVTSIELKESYVRDADTPGYFSPWSAEYKKDKKLKEAKPMFQDTPNEFAYLDFKKWAYRKRGQIKKVLLKALGNREDSTKMFIALRDIWLQWANANAKEWSYTHSTDVAKKNFGRALAVMMKKDGLILSKSGNKLTTISEAVYDKILKAVPDSYSYKKLAADIAKMIKDEYGSHNIRPFIKELTKLLKEGKLNEASNVWKRFDAMQKLQGNIMDVEDEMRDITNDLKQLHMDMEQEAEPGGGKVADRYGRDIEKKEKEYKKKKAEFKKLMKQLDKLEQF